MKFAEIRAGMFQRYMAGQYGEALAWVDAHAPEVPEQKPTIFIWQVCLAAVSGQVERALRTLAQAQQEQVWWHPDALRGDPDLAGLQGLPEFERLVEGNQALFEQARRDSRPQRQVLTPPAGRPGPYPLLLALHGMGGNCASSLESWGDLAEQGWIVAALQSSQAVNTDGYAWDERDKAMAEVQAHMQALCAEYPVDGARIVVGGFSQGGGLALLLVQQGRLPAAGFIAVAPWLPDIDELLATPAQPEASAARVPARGVLVLGGKDHNENNMFEKLETLLQQHALPYRRVDYPELGHEYPPDFEQVRDEALGYILQ